MDGFRSIKLEPHHRAALDLPADPVHMHDEVAVGELPTDPMGALVEVRPQTQLATGHGELQHDHAEPGVEAAEGDLPVQLHGG